MVKADPVPDYYIFLEVIPVQHSFSGGDMHKGHLWMPGFWDFKMLCVLGPNIGDAGNHLMLWYCSTYCNVALTGLAWTHVTYDVSATSPYLRPTLHTQNMQSFFFLPPATSFPTVQWKSSIILENHLHTIYSITMAPVKGWVIQLGP